ncbi:HSF-type DNA-binding-domain-containing protein [Circinella umbellata]|nr:HSF-type DNA-binding-domain-containing protein [Circinella umbellata]
MSSSSRRSNRYSEDENTSMEENSGDEFPSQDNTSHSRTTRLQPFETVMDGQSLTTIPITKTHAAFVSKLFNMVEDPEIQDLITWSDNGDVFRVFNPTAFSKNVLPRYFKHNNWQSFVRQLNMYGFNKVNDMIHSNLRNENQMWEFRHPHFRRGEVEDLRNIKRKSVRSLRATAPLSVNDGNDIQRSELLHQNYANLVDRMTRMDTSFESLLDEVSGLRDTVLKQHQYMEGIIQALDVICDHVPDGNKADIQAQLKTLRDTAASVSHLTPRPLPQQQQPRSRQQQPKMERLPSISISPLIENSVSPTSRRTTERSSIVPTRRLPSIQSSMMALGKQSQLLNPLPSEEDDDSIDTNDVLTILLISL